MSRLITVFEHDAIPLEEYAAERSQCLTPKEYELLRRLDEAYSHGTQARVFDWNSARAVKATSYVGVIQVPGLTIEILPKIDRHASVNDAAGGQFEGKAQDNLLHMLHVSGFAALVEKNTATLETKKLPLLEVLIRSFAAKLSRELRRGLHHAYVHREANNRVVKGRILIAQHLALNLAHKERIYTAFDEFLPDTLINQILKWAVRRLLTVARTPRSAQLLRESLLVLDEVSDIALQKHHFESLQIDRSNSRFELLLDFCRLIFRGHSPSFSRDRFQSLALVFPMERLFEAFIARIIQRHSLELGLGDCEIRSQATGRYLLLNEKTSKRSFGLRPDIWITRDRETVAVLDTKWKVPASLAAEHFDRVTQGDLYQMYAYAWRFDSPLNVLLYPAISGLLDRDYVMEDATNKRIRLATVGLSYDIRANTDYLLGEIARALGSRVDARAT